MRVLIAQDSPLVRAAIARLLQDAGVDVVAQAGDVDELLRKVRAHQPDVAIIDIRMLPRELDQGLQAARVIRAELPHVGVLLLSEQVEERCATELVEHGADGVGYLLQDRITDVGRFVDALHQIARRGAVLDPEVVAYILGRRKRRHMLDALSDRDRQVLAQVAAGASDQAIARRMFLSQRAVERHVSTIFATLALAPSGRHHRRVLAALAYLRAA